MDRAGLRRFVERKLLPHAARWDKRGRFPREILRECGRSGLLTADPRRNAVLAEELPRCESLGVVLSLFVQCNLIAPLLERLGSAAQKREFLKPLLRGELMGAMAVSEVSAGTDVSAIATHARRQGRDYVVQGTKTYITCGACADFLILAARTGSEPGLHGLSLMLAPVKTSGVRVQRLKTLGLRTSGMGKISLKDCRIPRASALGEEGAGFGHIQEALGRERLLGGLACVAWAEHAMQKTIAYARERHVFGRPLTRFQAVRHQFADMAIRLEAARQLNRATFERWMLDQDVTKEICMIKVFTYEAAQRVCEQCLQLHGGAGYLDDHWCSRFYRDARALTIAAGTPEVMKDLIAAHLRL